MSKLIHASKEKPVLFCKTCGIATNFVSKLKTMQPIRREKRKTWRRVNKKHPNPVPYDKLGVPIDGQQRLVYFSSIFLERGCFRKRHKLGVRFAPFPRFLLTELNFKRKGIVE